MTQSARMPTATQWWLAVAAISAALSAAAATTVLLSPVPLAPNVYLVGVAAFPVVGGLVIARRPDNLVGRLLMLVGAWNAIGSAANTYTWLGLEVGPLPAHDLAAWLATWAFWPTVLLMALLVAVFPSGRLASAWLRVTLLLGAAVTIVLTAAVMVVPVVVNEPLWGDAVRNPWGIAALLPFAPVGDVLPVLATVLIGLATVDLVLRRRRAQGVEALQMRWLALGFLTVLMLAVTGLVTDALGLTTGSVFVLVWLGFGTSPVAVGVAVTRYRLYEIDRLVSRTVTYALVAGMLVAVYAGGVLLAGSSLPLQGELAVAAATLLVAALFNPLRRRVQARVDRRFNRARYDAARAVERFTARLRDAVDLDDLTGGLLAVAAAAVQPAGAGLWLRGDHR